MEWGWEALLRLGVIFTSLILAFIARRWWAKHFREYDRSMLIRLGTSRDFAGYANVPVIVGRFPFSDLGGLVRSNLDVRDVVGFMVGHPKYLDVKTLGRMGVPPDPDYHTQGYYAYCVIQWEHIDMVKRFKNRCLYIRRTSYTGNNREPGMREDRFIGFGTNPTPDEEDHSLANIVHIHGGPLASFRCEPYLKGGFIGEDLEARVITCQAKTIRRLIKFGKGVKQRAFKER